MSMTKLDSKLLAKRVEKVYIVLFALMWKIGLQSVDVLRMIEDMVHYWQKQRTYQDFYLISIDIGSVNWKFLYVHKLVTFFFNVLYWV